MAQESVWKGPLMDFELLCWHGGCGVSRNDHTLHYGLSGQVVRGERGRFHPSPFNGEGLPAPIVKGFTLEDEPVECYRGVTRIRNNRETPPDALFHGRLLATPPSPDRTAFTTVDDGCYVARSQRAKRGYSPVCLFSGLHAETGRQVPFQGL